MSEVAAESVDELILIGSERGKRRLLKAMGNVTRQLVLRGRTLPRPLGLQKKLVELFENKNLDEAQSVLENLGVSSPVRISTTTEELLKCNLILSATNSAKPVIFPKHIKEHAPVVICDVAVPVDVDASVLEDRPNAVCLRGGTIRAPFGQDVSVAGISLPSGEIYGCLGETILMGLAGIGENFSYGNLSPLKIRRARDLARQHGFSVGENLMKG